MNNKSLEKLQELFSDPSTGRRIVTDQNISLKVEVLLAEKEEDSIVIYTCDDKTGKSHSPMSFECAKELVRLARELAAK